MKLILFLLFANQIYSSYGAIDLGSQYIKVSIMDIDGNIKIVPNSQNKMITPSAVAFKLDDYPAHHLTNIEALKASIKVGDNALPLLKKKPESGSAFIPQLIGRKPTNRSNFIFPQFVNASEMLALLFKNIFTIPELTYAESSAVAVPAYYTYDQRNDIIDAMWASDQILHNIVDDYQAIATLYSIRFAKRFSEHSQSILFVDAGGTSIKAYRGIFCMNHTTDPPTPLVNLTSYEWSETCGAYNFAIKYSKYKNISLQKAFKKLNDLSSLSKSELKKIFSHELISLAKLIRRAANGPIDCAQIFGGFSRASFISDAVFAACAGVEVRRDLPPVDSVSIGASYVHMEQVNVSLFQFPNVTLSSPYNVFVECNGVTDDYCLKGANCSEAVLLENARCEVINFFTDKEEVPEGCRKLVGKYELLNISSFPRGSAVGGFLVLKPPKPSITAALWCRNEDLYCLPVAAAEALSSELRREEMRMFVRTVSDAQKTLEKVAERKERIDELAARIGAFVEDSGNVKAGEVREDAMKKIENAREVRNKSGSKKKLKVAVEELEMIARYIGVPLN